jgi:hypothetical protein
MGNIIGMDTESLTLMMGRHEFKIPKTLVQGFNGSEVFLRIPALGVYRLEVKT